MSETAAIAVGVGAWLMVVVTLLCIFRAVERTTHTAPSKETNMPDDSRFNTHLTEALARVPSYTVYRCPDHGIISRREAGLDIACPLCLRSVLQICVVEPRQLIAELATEYSSLQDFFLDAPLPDRP